MLVCAFHGCLNLWVLVLCRCASGSVVHCCMQDVERTVYVEIGFIDNGYILATSAGYGVGCSVHNQTDPFTAFFSENIYSK